MIKVKDYEKIKRVHIDFPELMNEEAEESIIALFNKIKDLKSKAADLRMEAIKVDKQREELESQWNKILPLVEIEFEDKEFEEISNESMIGFNFSSEINKKVH